MSTLKRVAIFSVAYEPFIGGAEIAIREMAKRLPEFSFEIITSKLGNAELSERETIAANVVVFRLGGGSLFSDKLLYPLVAARFALLRHAKEPYALIHAVLETYAGLAALLFKKRRSSVPYVLTLQSGDPDEFIRKRTWFWSRWYRQVYTRANAVTAISLWLAERGKRYGFRGLVEIIPNGVDVAHFGGAMRTDERQFVRRSWGFGEKDFLVVTASRLVHKNGIDVLIASLEYLPKNVKLLIVGAGEDQEKFKLQVANSTLEERVIFLGEMGHADLPRVLKACDAFARPSRSEGLGIAFLEAMAARVPVVATPVGGIVDFLKDGETGLLAQVENPKSVAEKINQLSADAVLRKQLVKNAAALVKEKYDWDIIAEQYRRVYERLV